MKIFIGADHRGFKLKEVIKEHLKTLNFEFEDLGNKVFDPNDDYPDFARNVGRAVVKNMGRGILICGSGQGICMAANKIEGVRAATAFNAEQAKKSREHLDANIVCLSGNETSTKQSFSIIKTWLGTPFSNEVRHLRRINKIKQIEDSK